MENIHESWKPLFNKYDFDLDNLYNSENIVYPPKEQIFKVFEMDVNDIKVVLLGQDPYHNNSQAHGLSFSVANDSCKTPPSLKNIFKELQHEFPEREYVFSTNCLERWFYEEKIFLLNASLSVIKNKPASHMKIWEKFTNDVIKYINEILEDKKCVFLLLGNFAKSKQKFITNPDKVIIGVHPSPLSANKGFFNSNIFKLVEEKLGEKINWSV